MKKIDVNALRGRFWSDADAPLELHESSAGKVGTLLFERLTHGALVEHRRHSKSSPQRANSNFSSDFIDLRDRLRRKGRTARSLVVPVSNAPPCGSLDLFSVFSSSTPWLHFGYSQLVCLLSVVVLERYVYSHCLNFFVLALISSTGVVVNYVYIHKHNYLSRCYRLGLICWLQVTFALYPSVSWSL